MTFQKQFYRLQSLFYFDDKLHSFDVVMDVVIPPIVLCILKLSIKLFILVSWDRSSFVSCLVHWGSTDALLLLQISSDVVWQSRDLQLSHSTLYLLSLRLCFFIVLLQLSRSTLYLLSPRLCCLIVLLQLSCSTLYLLSPRLCCLIVLLQLSRSTLYLLSPRLCCLIVLNRDLFVYRDDSLTN